MAGGMKVHRFKERLQFSQDHRNEPFWQAVYEKAFPNMEFAMPVTEKSQGQYLGIDRVIYLNSGKTLYVDEKLREKVYSDILLEYLSNDRTQAPGWMEKDLLIDYMAYAFLPIQKCYLFDWQMLKRTWKYYRNIWIKEFGTVTAKNQGYNTLSVPVPTELLLSKVSNASIIQL